MRKTPPPIWLYIAIIVFSVVSCKKTLEPQDMTASDLTVKGTNAITAAAANGCYQALQPDAQNDTIHTRTVLGRRLTNNPYSVVTMQQASRNLYGQANGISINKKYVRFKPSSESQLEQLVALGLPLFDYPLDYEVTQQGDYYDQGLPATEIPWFYTVVDPTFTAPSGIQYQLLADLHVPPTNVYLENEAFRITGNPVEPLTCGTTPVEASAEKNPAMLVPPCPADYHWDYQAGTCVPNNCSPGYYWDGTQCVRNPTTPPPPPASTRPAGQIRVRDNAIGGDVPVRQTRVLLKRWFKLDLVNTDDNGRFTTGKNYRRVEVTVYFDNSRLHVKGLRGVRFWQMELPMSQGLGRYSGDLSAVDHVFSEGTDFRSRMYRNWWGAQLMNAYVEYNTMATAFGTGTLPTDMVILLTNWGGASGTGSAVMNRKRVNNGTIPREWIGFYVANPLLNGVTTLFNYLVQGHFLKRIDITLGYNVNFAWRSDMVKALMYHELSHAAHFNKVGAAWWNSFVYAEETTIIRHTGANDPYGDGTDGISSEYISVGESWAEHMARTMCDRQYPGTNSTEVIAPGPTPNYFNNIPVAGLTSHLNYLEGYNPNDANNPFRWIPEGIFYDLIDARNEPSNPIIDGVSNFTNAQVWNALDADIRSMPQYRDRLIGENPNNQTVQVRNLFAQYRF